MRSILVLLFLILYWIISIPLFLAGLVLAKRNPKKWSAFAQRFVVAGFRGILFISGVRITVKGQENILHGQSALYVYNHRSFFDVLVGYVTAPVPTSFVSKKEIAKVPMISRWMRHLNCLFLDREDIRQGMKTILEGIELMKDGTSVYIAPEGTRNTGDGVLPLHVASFKLAEKSGRPIVPVAMSNNDAVFEQHLPWIHKAHVIVEYCEPIYMDQMERSEKKQIGETVRGILAEKVAANQREI